MSKQYPFLDLRDATRPLRDDIVAAVTRVIDSGRYVGGDECAAFEAELSRVASLLCVGVSNGLDALRLIFRALVETGRLRRGDRVIVPANTYIASILAVTDNGLTPVFVEPDERSMNLEPDGILRAADDSIRAVLLVHLYGRTSGTRALVDELHRRGIIVVEDVAQAIGAMSDDGIYAGALGDASAFSFYPTKNIGAIGDAGAVSTADADLAAMVRALANYGSDRRYHNIVEGYNCRLDPVQAAILRVKLKHIDDENRRRRNVARIYSERIANPALTLPLWSDKGMVWHQYVVRTDRRDAFTRHLDQNGVGWDIHYAVPPHRQPCYADRYGNLDLPVTMRLADSVVSLPISPSTSADDARAIADIINRF